ncbi:MAG: cobalamin-dependent protein [Planctomycetes bacterium]|nr:cobalamin-dependent protein [Planctomycetota bacterium]MCB9870528.1 cobalamin B12-binding domain-containing protein [Planctomycetota bacterium]
MKVVLSSVSFATPYTPQLRFLSLGYLHANALADEVIRERAEIVHNYYDPSLRSPEEIAKAIAAEAPDVVGFTCYVWNAPDNLRICKVLKEMLPELVVILGGPEVSYHYNKLLNAHSYVDFIGVGEGEHTFREFLRALVLGRREDLLSIAGLAQRKDGKPFLPAPRAYEKDLDLLPSPYLTGVLDVCDVRGGVNYQTARGCPFVCTYCDYGRNQPYFEFSMERVRAEFELFKQMGARILFNTDPTFNYSRKRAEGILQLGIDLDIKAIHWFEVFPTLINQDLVELVKDSYLSFIGCGIQTCTPQTMRNIRRVWRPEKVAPILDALSYKRNIILSYEIIMGLPGDNVQSYKDTMSWTYARHPADIKSFNLAILPRTPLEKEVEKWGIEYDPDVGHEILATQDMDRKEVLVGKAVNDWHRLLQNVFFRLVKVIDEPAGELIEKWGWVVYDAGFHDHIPDLQVHRIPTQLIEALAGLWERFVADLCVGHGVADVSLQFRELLRYHFFRRARTWASAFFADVRDIYFNEPYPELHRVFAVSADRLPAEPVDAEVLGAVPQLGGNVDHQLFAFDMHDLYPLSSVEELAAVPSKSTDYLFFMTPDTGAGCAIAVDAAARKFVELVDGRRSVAEIEQAMNDPRVPKIYQALRATGLFDRPRFLSSYEEGTVAWQSCFPEVYRAYH